ncbi:hypothetical protein ACIRPR_06440 [Streptomyces griseoflavus]|uniref:hypothetical protein n=1 Tax=Streptomyces griseoflavus TaxID=35619 RepID=UPI0037FC9636
MITPADELRAAAAKLRPSSPAVAAHTVAVRVPPAAADALAAWLDETANNHDAAVTAARQVWGDDAAADALEWLTTGPGRVPPHAVALARAVNGEAQR